ncbi:MAG: glycerol-3-phosphate dehydrogenase C-terminal domain-containing protein, partial [Bdellovibrionales bacterium]
TDPRGVTFVAGGKYTTYRNMAEQTMDEVLRHFSVEERARYNNSQTLQALNPLVTENLLERAQIEHKIWAKDWQIPEQVTRALADRHGLEARNIIRQALPVRARCKDAEEWMWCAEALHAIENTMCLSLTDFYLRRTHLILAREDHGLLFAKAIAQVMGERLGWDANRREHEINALQNQLAFELAATM